MTATAGLVTIGETMALFSAQEPGALRHQSALRVRVGGAESNTAIAASRLGTPAAWIGRVGDDGLGDLVVDTLRGAGLAVTAIIDPAPTSIMVKEHRSPATTEITYYRANGPGAHLTPDDLDEALIRQAGVVHLTGITPALSASARRTVFAAAEVARDAGVPVSFDVNFRSKLWSAHEAGPVLRDLASRASIVFVGEDEAAVLGVDADQPRAITEAIARWGPTEVVLKRGAQGACALEAGRFVRMPATPAVVVDVVGAGDAFAGGYLAEFLIGEPPEAKLETGTRCGAVLVGGHGDWEPAPSRRDLALGAHPAAVMR